MNAYFAVSFNSLSSSDIIYVIYYSALWED